MDKYLEKFKVTHYEHCIIKEELIISDDEEDEYEGVKTKPSDKSFVDSNVEHSESYETTKGPFKRKRSGRLRNENDNARNDKQVSLDLFLKSKNFEKSERFENLKNVTRDEKSGARVAYRSNNIDELLKNLAKFYCSKCNVKGAVIRRNARCLECQTKLTYSCEACNKIYRDFPSLGYHLQSKHTKNPQTHPCPVCNKSFAYRKGMQKHRRAIHNSATSLTGEQPCSKCGKKFESKHIREHEKVCDAEPPLKCDKCPYVSFCKSNLTSHMLAEHVNFKKKCENCNKTFTNRKSMQTHLRVYCNKVKRFECHHCGHKAYLKNNMLTHLDRAHFEGSLTGKGVNQRNCKYCNTTLGRCKRMKYHLKRCESAPRRFRPQSSPAVGRDKSPRTCDYCGLTLKPYDRMRNHLDRCESAPPDCRLETETADQPDLDTACKNLSKVYCCNCKDKKPLTRGVRRCEKCETRLKFTCETCPKSFNILESLLNHLRVTHMKNKTIHPCDKCDRSYSRLANLKLHKRTHHPSEPITKICKCSTCGKNYKNPESLRKHRVWCAEEPKFHCDKCPYKTHFKSSLVKHFRTKRATCI